MLILGIDPGSITTGYGIISFQERKMRYVTSGCVRIGKQDLGLRLKHIFDDITEILHQFAPTCCAIEKVFVHKNPASALKLGQARGAAIVAAASSNLEIAEYSPREIKQAVVGYGAAAKEQVQHMVQVLLQLHATPATDAADALAVAICHASHANYVRYTRNAV